MIVWLLCSAFLLLGFALGVYAAYPQKTPSVKWMREPTRLTDVDK